MRKIVFAVAIIILSLPFNSNSQTSISKGEFGPKIDAYIHQLTNKVPEIPGLAIVVIKDDQPVFMKAFGWANKEDGTKADEKTMYYIASSTKSFTALAAALLDKEGKIKLDSPFLKYTKGIVFKNHIPSKITVRDLLTHTSGLQNDPLTFRLAYSGEIDHDEILKVFADATTYVDSNYGKYNYDNLGYNIYTLLLQQHLGKNWKDLLTERIFSPLKMSHTSAYKSYADKNAMFTAAPYFAYGPNGMMRYWLPKVDNNMQSAGGLFTSIEDIGTWLRMNMNNGKIDGKEVIDSAVLRECQTGYTNTQREPDPFPGAGQYGLGWQIGKYKEQKVIYHFGGFPGYRSHISFMPDRKIAVAVLVNESSVGSPIADMLATYAYDWWLKTPMFDTVYAKQLQMLLERKEGYKANIHKGYESRAGRVSQLTKPLETYIGTYRHPYFGTIEIFNEKNNLSVKMGAMQYSSTPFTKKESIRVELIPGDGRVVQFVVNNEGKIDKLVYDGNEFVRQSK